MTQIDAIRESCRRRGVTRLCHVTAARNIPHIITSGQLLSTRALRENDLPANPNDDDRLDGHDDCISCSVEYPNVWFLNQVAARQLLFRDWVVLAVAPDFLWKTGCFFSPVNAARDGGRHIDEGAAAFDALYDDAPRASRFQRSMLHLDACPTDNQAEVLVPGPIPLESITAIIFPSQDAAQAERERLGLLQLSTGSTTWRVSREMFDAYRLAGRILSGERVAEDRVAAVGLSPLRDEM